MRIDKFVSSLGFTRKEAEKFIKNRKVTINGCVATKKDTKLDESIDRVCICGKEYNYSKFIYIMMNKPSGVLSATEDKTQPTIISLLPKNLQNVGLFPVGRLDKETLGLIILTNDGEYCHKMISPKRNISKVYKFELADKLDSQTAKQMEQGVELKDGYKTLPCKIIMTDDKKGEITITEGKYHQIRRMFGAVGNKIVYLERIKEGDLVLDSTLNRGEWRYLNQQEILLEE